MESRNCRAGCRSNRTRRIPAGNGRERVMTEEIMAAARIAWLEECAHIADTIAAQAGYVDGDRIYQNGWKAAAERIATVIREHKPEGN